MANLRTFAELRSTLCDVAPKYSSEQSVYTGFYNSFLCKDKSHSIKRKSRKRRETVLFVQRLSRNLLGFWNNYFEVYFTTFIQLEFEVARHSGLIRRTSIFLLST